MNVVNQYGEKRNGFAEVVGFCHVMCRYFDRFLLQGVDKPGFLKLILCGLSVCVRVCVCPRPRLLITSGVMWRDIDLI